jgi:hypothetical protein
MGPKGERGEPGLTGPKGDSVPGPQGPQGPKGERGDVTVIGDVELADAIRNLRIANAKWQAAWMAALARNAGRRHPGLKSAVEAVLQKLKADANGE